MPDSQPGKRLLFGSIVDYAVNGPNARYDSMRHLAEQSGLNPSTFYKKVMRVDGRALSADDAIAMIYGTADPEFMRPFLHPDHFLTRRFVNTPGFADLRDYFITASADHGRFAEAVARVMEDGDIDDDERRDLLRLLDTMKNTLASLERTLRKGEA